MTASTTLRDEKQKAKKATATDKSGDKKALTRKSLDGGVSVRNVNPKSKLVKTISSPAVVKKITTAGKNAVATGKVAATTTRASEKPSTNKKNVMNTIHNVTVASPPTSASKERSASTSDIQQEAAALNHSRTLTRTIDPKDSILNQLAQSSVASKLLKEPAPKPAVPVKEAIAYELNFEEAKKPKKEESQEEDDFNYESDFESYESDFEPEVPSSSESSEKLQESSSDELEGDELDKPDDDLAKPDKERVDSGSFEMRSKKPVAPLSPHYDSIDDTINSHDSGISYERAVSPRNSEIFKRGKELMKKITFDELNFDFFEARPVPYETFMAIYGGQVDMFQVSTQCEAMTTVDEVQTELITTADSWTQFPAKFTSAGFDVANSKLYNEEKLGVGEGNREADAQEKGEAEQFSIDTINNFAMSEEVSFKSQLIYDTFELQRFVESAAMTISNVMDNQTKQRELKPSRISISRGFTPLNFGDVKMLQGTTVQKLYTNMTVHNFLVTVHKRTADQQNFLCLWDVLNTKRPLKVFSSWSDVKCLEIHDQQRDVIIGGCSDGTISLWDAQELPEWKNEDEELATSVKPCGIISLNQSSNDFALDNVVALKSLPYREYKSTSSMFSQSQASQICSLHRNGTVNIWTISRFFDENASKRVDLDYTHIKSRVKLIKNLTIDLNVASKIVEDGQVRRKSAFEKTRYYFENDLFSDKVLKELQEIDSSRLSKAQSPLIDDQLMRFNHLAVNLNEIFVATDLNFILAVSRLNLSDNSRKIFTNNSSFIAPTAVQVHPVNKNVIVVGQANGEVKFMKLYDDEANLHNSSLKTPRKSADAGGGDLLSKSCAFQNIVENEKKLYGDAFSTVESDEMDAFLVNEALSEQFTDSSPSDTEKLKVPFDRNIFNSFEVAVGTVTSIVFSKSGELAFVLVGNRLRIFNCWANAEVEQQDRTKFCDVKCVQGADSAEYLVSFLLKRAFKALSELSFKLLIFIKASQ